MASEAIAIHQIAKSDSQTTVTSSAAGFTIGSGSQMKNDTFPEKSSRNSSSCDEDGFGDLVIDTDEDTEKGSKEKPFRCYQAERKSPIRNNNNNNSAARSVVSNKYISSTVKDGNTSKTLSTNKLSLSLSQNSVNFQSSKISKSKSKKSSKPNKSHTPISAHNSTSFGSSSRTSSPGASFIGALDTDSNHSHSFDSRGFLPRTSSSPDDNSGKKSKSSKSKSHHKRHSKHNEKSTSGNSSNSKADISIEKTKSKSKHSTNLPVISSSASSSNTSTFSLSTVLHDFTARAANTVLSVDRSDKVISGGHLQNIGHKYIESTTSQPTTHIQKLNTSASQGRVPACTALVDSSTTGNGARITQAYSQREHSESELPVSQSQSSRKRHKKALASTFASTTDSIHSRCSSYQGSSSTNGGKRTSTASTLQPTSSNDSTRSKKIKLETDSNLNPPRLSVNTTLEDSGSVTQTSGESKIGSSQDSNRLGIISKSSDDYSGNFSLDSGVKSAVTRVFAPSSHFATSLPRFNVSNSGEFSTSPGRSKDVTKQQNNEEQSLQDGNPVLLAGNSRSVGTVTCTADVGVMTEPDALGPCEPGTSVHLDGIVWHETDTGVLVVNVTWRSRTYVGTLLDATKHDWAPPRFSDNDLDMELRGKSNRPKRSRAVQNENNRKGRSRTATSTAAEEVKNSPSAAAKRRNKNSESELTNADNECPSTPKSSSSKRPRLATSRGGKDTNQLLQTEDTKTELNAGSESSSCSSPVFIECPHPKCNKRYKYPSGLKYHQVHAHGDVNDEEQKEMNDEEIATDVPSSSPDETILESNASDTDLPSAEDQERSVTFLNDKVSKSSPTKSIQSDTGNDRPVVKNIAHAVDPSNVSFCTVQQPNSTGSSGFSTEASKYPLKPEQPHSPVQSHREEHLKSSDNNTQSFSYKFPSEQKIPLSSCASSALPFLSISTAGSKSLKDASHSHPPHHQHHHSLTTSDAVDTESEEAVKNLLQLQDNDDSILPGLSSSYNQDSPHPTLSLGSRTVSTPGQEHLESSQSFPSRSSSVKLPPSASANANNSLLCASNSQYGSSMLTPTPTEDTNAPSASVLARSPAINAATTAVFSSTDDKPATASKEQLQDFSNRFANAPDMPCYTVASTTHISGAKIAKGKTVPVPLDPNYLQSTYAGSASQNIFSNSAKKVKRKKKAEGKLSESPERLRYGIDQGLTQTSPDISNSNSAGAVSNARTNNTNLAFPKSHAGATQDNHPLSMGLLPDTGRRVLPPQSTSGSRKFPGIISPVSSSQGNNITVTGTFHPHPDPHKPQTAVSAQVQDRVRFNRPTSPTPSNSNKNANRLSGRTHYPPVSRSRPSSAHSERASSDKPPSQDQEVVPRYKVSDAKSQQEEPTLDRMQIQVDSAIDDVYSKELANRGKALAHPNATNVLDHVRGSPVAIQRVPSTEKSPVIINDDSKKTPQKIVPKTTDTQRPSFEETVESRRSTPSPRSRMIVENQRTRVGYPPLIGSQMLQMGLGYIPPHLMDSATFHQIAAAQYLSDPQLREKYESTLQAFAQQQHIERHQRANTERSTSPDKEEMSWHHHHHPKQQHSKNSPSPSPITHHHQHPLSKDKIPGHTSLASHSTHGPNSSYKPPHPPSLLHTPVPRCHSAASNPPTDFSRSHVRSESLDRGRASFREETRSHKKSPSPSVKIERSPDKVKENFHRQSGSRSPAINNSGPVPYYPYLMERPPFPGPYPSFPPGAAAYVFPGHPILHPQAGWIQGAQQAPVAGKLSPPLKPPKDRLSPVYKASSREDIKPKEFSLQYAVKGGRGRENAESLPDRKPAISPDTKPVQTSPALPKKSVSGSSASSEFPTQMHHHTHHHIHDVGGVVFPPRYYPSLGGPDAVPPYPVPYQKRE